MKEKGWYGRSSRSFHFWHSYVMAICCFAFWLHTNLAICGSDQFRKVEYTCSFLGGPRPNRNRNYAAWRKKCVPGFRMSEALLWEWAFKNHCYQCHVLLRSDQNSSTVILTGEGIRNVPGYKYPDDSNYMRMARLARVYWVNYSTGGLGWSSGVKAISRSMDRISFDFYESSFKNKQRERSGARSWGIIRELG